MNQTEQGTIEKGRRKTLTVIFALIGFSILISVFSQLMSQTSSQQKMSQDIIRLILEIGLYYAIFLGKNWARIIMTILFSLGIFISVVSMISLFGKTPGAFIMLILVIVYGFAIYFFNLDKDFKSFFENQKTYN
jgi:hypothetical protein